MKRILFAVLCLMAVLLPDLAMADTLAPLGKTDWDIYVFGNGLVVNEILSGVTLLMVGHSSSFTTLLVFMASLGFLSLAISAGIDPGKNMLKMFVYILMVWMVTYASTSLTANVVITDTVQDGSSTNAVNEYRIAGVPAMVVLPAALTSELGMELTKYMETYFRGDIGTEFTVSGAGGGQFNLANKMIKDANTFKFTVPELKKTLNAYVTNCVVPALALGRLQGPSGPGGASVSTGLKALTETTDFLQMLGSATSDAILTPYYPVDGNTSAVAALPEMQGVSSDDLTRLATSGFLVSCSNAYTLMSADLNVEAQNMVGQGNAAWAKAGVLVPFEQAYTTLLAQASANGSVAANFSSPSGLILQEALLNSMGGTFREAALQTGNNELMQSAAMAQAEQQQKSAWVAGFGIFNNMMGYVFSVLQAFIFALTPIIVIALMIPGMGKTMLTNYAQILVWMTLWTPLLSIINFIITLFGSHAFADSIGSGLSAHNKGDISERATDLVIAAQFLGTMVPMLTWGIVKGAMAFTDFISHGMGSAFSSQAGATAATGNMSMNNLSMDNTSMSKYNTMSSSAVGAQEVQGAMGVGSAMVTQALGGGSVTANGSTVDSKAAFQNQLQDSIQKSQQVAHELGSSMNKSLTVADLLSTAADSSKSSAERTAAQETLAHAVSASTGKGHSEAMNIVQTAMKDDSGSAGSSLSSGVKASIGVKAGAKFLGEVIGVSGGIDASTSRDRRSGTDTSARVGEGVTDTSGVERDKKSFGTSDSKGDTDSHSSESASARSQSRRASHDEGAVLQRAASEAYKDATSFSAGLSAMQSMSQSYGWANSNDVAAFEQRKAQLEAMGAGMGSASELRTQMQEMVGQLNGDRGQLQKDFSSKQAANAAGLRSLQRSVGGAPASVAGGSAAAISSTGSQIDSLNAQSTGQGEKTKTDAKASIERAKTSGLDMIAKNQDEVRGTPGAHKTTQPLDR